MKHFYTNCLLIAFAALTILPLQPVNAQVPKKNSYTNQTSVQTNANLVQFDEANYVQKTEVKGRSAKATITDVDGNIYDTVHIGSQAWLKQNLKTTKYNDGTSIPLEEDAAIWASLTTPAMSWYNNDQATNGATYGALYNWYAVSTDKLCPSGWHVPTDDDFKTMEMYMGMTQTEADAFGWRGTNLGNMLKTTSGWTINTGTNSIGFSAYPAGYRSTAQDGMFQYMGMNTGFWTSSEFDADYAINRGLDYIYSTIARGKDAVKSVGVSVRCFKKLNPIQSFGGGSGTELDPYWVENAEQLNNVRNFPGAYFIQTANIDLSGSPWSDLEGWEPIGNVDIPFNGSYNGNDYAITGLTINNPTQSFVGLFGVAIGANFSHIGISGSVIGSWDVGMLVGLLQESGNIVDCYANGDVTGEIFVGGLVGYLYYNSTCGFSYSTGTVTGVNGADGSQQLGGLIGRVRESSSVNQCYSNSKLQGTGYWNGGLIGLVSDISQVNNSYATGSVLGEAYNGGLVGRILNSAISNSYSVGKVQTGNGGGLVGDEYLTGSTALNSYWNSETSGFSESPLGEAKTTLQLVTSTSFTGWDLSGTWAMSEGITYPYLVWQGSPATENYPTTLIPPSNLTAIPSDSEISLSWNAPSMGSVSSYLIYRDGSYYTSTPSNTFSDAGLTNYINHYYYVTVLYTSGYESPASNVVNTFSHTGFSGGTGTASDPYWVSTAGELYTIRLYLNSNFKQTADIDLNVSPWNSGEGWDPIGGFGNSFNGTYDGSNFTISNLYIYRPSLNAVGLFGQMFYATVSNLNIINATIYGNEYVGSLAGDINYTTVKKVKTSSNITATRIVGGVVGGNYSTSVIENCQSKGTLFVSDNWVGGIAGLTIDHALINRCESFASSTANGFSAGGITGTCELLSTISNSYSTGAIMVDQFGGGLIGWCDSSSVINSYSVGLVSGNSNVGGLVGNYKANNTFTNSYWDIETSGQSASGGGFGRSSAQMKYPHNDGTTYLGWDFTSVWNYDIDLTVNNGYPYLRDGGVSLPTIIVSEVTTFDFTTAVANGNVTSDGGAEVSARGVVWATYSLPTLDTHEGGSSNGSGIGEFTANLTGLISGNKYFVRAYATNSVGTAYSNEVSFVTLSDNITVTFNCDMTREINVGNFTPGIDVLYATGSFTNVANPFNGWDEPGTGESLVLTDTDNDMIYTGQVSMATNFGLCTYKYFKNAGWMGGEWLLGAGHDREVVIGAVDTIVNNVYGVVESTVIFDPAYLVGYTLPSGFQLTTIGGKYYLEVALNGWGTHLPLPKAITLPTNLNMFKSDIMYSENGSGYAANNLQAYIECVGEWGTTTDKFSGTLNPAPISFSEIKGLTQTGWPIRNIQVAAQYKLDPSWEAITGGLMYVGKMVAYHADIPVVTASLSSFSYTSAHIKSEIVAENSATVTERGVIWSKSSSPTIDNAEGRMIDGAGSGIFSIGIMGLTSETYYYVRAYAIYEQGISYSNDLYFYTPYYSSGPVAQIEKATTTITIDGIEEAAWEFVTAHSIDKPFRNETPTLETSGSTYWKALWDVEGIYVLLNVADDYFYPAYDSPNPTLSWDYDKPELYFDVNEILLDGEGPSTIGTGHYQVAPDMEADYINGTQRTNMNGVHAFNVYNPNYVAEYFIDFYTLFDRNSNLVDPTRPIGFDITVIDRDTEIEGRSRLVWSNNGDVAESWTNLDQSGTIELMGATNILKPSISSVSHYGVNANSASLVGTVNAQGSSTSVTFLYGTTPSLGNGIIPSPSTVDGNNNTNVTANLTALASGQTYYYQLEAININGATYSEIKSFTTTNCAETVTITGPLDLCSGAQNVSYVATFFAGATYNWTVDGGTVATGQGSNSITIDWNSATVTGYVYVSVNITSECFASDDLQVSFSGASTLPTPVIHPKGPLHILICTTPNMQYKWFKNGEELVGETGQFIVAKNNSGEYSVAISNNSTCWSYSETVIVPAQKSMLIYPNPVQNKTMVTFEDVEIGKGTIRVLDVFGKTVYQHGFDKPNAQINEEIDLTQLQKGVYVIELSVNDIKRENQQIVIN